MCSKKTLLANNYIFRLARHLKKILPSAQMHITHFYKAGLCVKQHGGRYPSCKLKDSPATQLTSPCKANTKNSVY